MATLNKKETTYLEIQTSRKSPMRIIRTSYYENGQTKHRQLGGITHKTLNETMLDTGLKNLRIVFSRQTILGSVFKLFIEAKKDGSHLKAKIGLLKLLHLMFLLMSINQNQLTILNDKDNHDKQNLAA